MLKVEVKDFGPIREGSVTLRPLTIFVGPNNVGKSYLALLIYAIFTSFHHAVSRVMHFPAEVRIRLTKSVKKWFISVSGREGAVSFDELPRVFKQRLRIACAEHIERIPLVLSNELQRCFASELPGLTRKQSETGFRLSIEWTELLLNIKSELKNGKLQVIEQKFDVSKQVFDPRDLIPFRQDNQLVLALMVNPLSRSFYRFTYYFPAARSGVLHSHKALASVVVSRSPLAGIVPIEIPKLSGVVADLISTLLRLQRREYTAIVSDVAVFLENEVSKGRIDIESTQTGFEYPEIYYESEDERFPLYRTSSMVSEIAPIVLFLKYLINQGDLLIIEEPEAHLHPDNQRIFAWAIVKLIRLGVHVLITTHSDYFVQQISNFILLSRVSEAERVNLKYAKDDYLRADEVGAYLFKLKRGGSVVEPLEVTAEDGIPDDQFLKITEAMLNETARLQRPRVHA